MQVWYLLLALGLLLTVIAGMVRVLRGPTPADCMLAALLFGTTGIAILLLFAQGLRLPALYDVALILALLAAVAVVAFVRRTWQPAPTEAEGSDVPR
jgi:multicomponent Na+:H+ antiporter subunit F